MTSYRISTDKTWAETVNDLEETFRKWGVGQHWSIEPWRQPKTRAQSQDEATRTVVLTFTLAGREITLVSKRQNRAIDNLRALYLCVERMRMIEVAGLSDIVQQAYAQLPPPADPSDPYAVLGVPRTWDLDTIEGYYRNLIKTVHPDVAGPDGNAQAQRYTEAMTAIRKERK